MVAPCCTGVREGRKKAFFQMVVYMDYSKMTVEESRNILLQHNKNITDLLEKLSLSDDVERINLVSKISPLEMEEKFGKFEREPDALKYRYETLERVLNLLDSGGLVREDFVIWSHYNAIIHRLDNLLGYDIEEEK